MIAEITLLFFSLVLFSELLTLVLFQYNYKVSQPTSSVQDWPKVTILIAARNEEANLDACLESISAVGYPFEKLEVLIGNDQSTDKTQQIIDRFVANHSAFRSVPTLPTQNGLIAKSNVLAQLADHANGSYLVILDADVQVSPNWLKVLVAQAENGYGVVSGYTEVIGIDFFSQLQKMDWQSSIHTLKVFSDIGLPLSALGNNMLVSKDVYNSIGGFRALGATKVEDLKMTNLVFKKGYAFFQLVSNQKGKTKAMTSFWDYILQRKRWLSGVIRYRPLAAVGFVLVRLMLVLLIFTMFFVTTAFQASLLLSLTAFKILIEYLKIRKMASQSGDEVTKFSMITPVLIAVLDTFAFINLILKPRIVWKKRKY